jgi:hypothetical protein
MLSEVRKATISSNFLRDSALLVWRVRRGNVPCNYQQRPDVLGFRNACWSIASLYAQQQFETRGIKNIAKHIAEK